MTSLDLDPVSQPSVRDPGRSQQWIVLRRSLRSRPMQIGLAITLFMIALAIFGPYLAPHSPTEFVAAPFSGPSRLTPLGTDYLGDDVLSRILWGGRTVVGLSFAATTVGVLAGIVTGFLAVSGSSRADDVVMGLSDIILAFPQLVFVLVFVSILGPRLWLIVLTVGLTHMPRVARLVRSVTLDLNERDFIRSADIMGLGKWRIFAQETLPNLSTPLLIEYGLRLTWSIGIIAGLSFLGFGIQPPQSDWGLMINENRLGITTNVWAVAAPVLCIFLFTIGTNLMTEGLSRSVAGIDRGGAAE